MENTHKINVNNFSKGMVKDIAPEMLQEGQYLHARNAVNNTSKGDMFKIGNEPSNFECIRFNYTYIGNIPLINSRYVIFSTNDSDSEIGIFDEKNCTYDVLINDSNKNNKLGFRLKGLIKGVSKENWDCTESIYWNDGINPARYLNLSKIPYVKKYKPNPEGGCDIEEETKEIDIEKLRLSPLIKIPKIKILKGDSSGSLPNGAYRVALSYSTDTFRITDYLIISDPIFIHNNFPSGSIEIEISEQDKNFENYELVLISTVNQQTTARRLGFFPSEQKKVYVDVLKQDDTFIDISQIPLQSIYYEGGDAIFQANDYLIQTGVRTRPEFNYQPQANKIKTKWVAYAVPPDYYAKGGNKIGYTKGEVIPLFIRFVYDTGHRSSAFSIVGRLATNGEKEIIRNQDSLNIREDGVEKWEIYDTSTITQTYPRSFEEEYIAYEGELGYYEANDFYPDNKEVWKENACKPVRHGRFPDNCTVPNYDPLSNKILILGLKFENIEYPKDEKGIPIPGIVGYEILRGDKEGNKSIIAKGLIFNTGEYELPISYNENRKAIYPNYPFNDLRTDPYLSKEFPKGGCEGRGYKPVGTFRNDIFTFHSPETHFANPTLGSYLKVESEYYGKAQGYFEPVYNHPKHKLIRDFALLFSATLGIGEGILAIRGKTTTTYQSVSANNTGDTAGVAAQAGSGAVAAGFNKVLQQMRALLKTISPTLLVSNTFESATEALGIALGAIPGVKGSTYTYTKEDTAFKNVPSFLRIGSNVVMFSYFFAQGTSTILNLIKNIIPYRQYAYQCNMSGIYTNSKCVDEGNQIRKIEDYSYLYSGVQNFQKYLVNNNLRESSIIIKTKDPIRNPSVKDNSRQTIGTLRQWENPSKPFETDISAYYVSIKRDLRNLYGQLYSIRIVPTTSEIFPIKPGETTSTPIIFGGDTIIEEFTLKRKNNLFTQTQADGTLANPNGYEFDYRMYPNILYPRYWMDTQSYDLSQFFNITNIRLPNDNYHLDRDPVQCRRRVGFSVSNGYMYTSVNGIVRFYVESSYNLPFRKQHLNDFSKVHFNRDNFTDLSILFRSDVIRNDNYFEIDKSLSPIKQLNLTYSQLLPRDFSVKNNNCFTYEKNKLIYSLPSSIEQKIDNWRNFLVNNYWTFSKSDGELVSIRNVNRTGVLYFFSSGPLKIHPGVDELQTEGGLKVVLGDGGLFARQPQTVTNSDFDFTECQSSFGIVSTQYGVFFISQRQGKIFHFAEGARDISSPIKFWLAEYLPSKLLEDFPNYELKDNPNIGIGCMAAFDNINEVVYFSKIDYKLKEQYKNRVTYLSENQFLVDGIYNITLGDPEYFEDASWTLSYDPKQQIYISFHDWHPEAFIQTKRHFATVKRSIIWKHNSQDEEYCNFYGVDYPWEIEYPYTNLEAVTTLESLEYQLQAFDNQPDRAHILNENFDRAVIWNTEQCSGLLKLHMREPNRVASVLEYPKYTSDSVHVEVAKVENKYRFNQIRDLVRDRGEFTFNWKNIWKVKPNGYEKELNTENINYQKLPGQRKKIRNFSNIVFLRKTISKKVKFLLTLIVNKQQISFR